MGFRYSKTTHGIKAYIYYLLPSYTFILQFSFFIGLSIMIVLYFLMMIKQDNYITLHLFSLLFTVTSWTGTHLKHPERHKLDDVAEGDVAPWRAQDFVVAVQELHGAEVLLAHAHDDDGHGEAGGLDDGGDRLVHVRDHAVGDDEQHKVLLCA